MTPPMSKPEIYKIIDREIAESDFDPVCIQLAEQQSNGNEDLRLALYLKHRVASLEHIVGAQKLEIKPIDIDAKQAALEERRLMAVTSRVKYRRQKLSGTRGMSFNWDAKVVVALMNAILLVGMAGSICSFWVLSGHTLLTLPYLKGALFCTGVVFLLWLVSRIRFAGIRPKYTSVLMVTCWLISLLSVVMGGLLIKYDPDEAYEKVLAQKREMYWEQQASAYLKEAQKGDDANVAFSGAH